MLEWWNDLARRHLCKQWHSHVMWDIAVNFVCKQVVHIVPSRCMMVIKEGEPK